MKFINLCLTFTIFVSSVMPVGAVQITPTKVEQNSQEKDILPTNAQQSQKSESRKKRKKLRYVEKETSVYPVNEYSAFSNNIYVQIKQYPLIGKPTKINKRKKRFKKRTSTSFYPVEIVVENKSAEDVHISPEMLEIKTMDYEPIAKNMVTGNSVLGLLIGSACFPVACGGIGFALDSSYLCILTGLAFGVIGAAISLGVLTIGLPVAFYYKHQAYLHNIKIFEEQLLYKSIITKPGETLRKFVFINELDFQPTFKLYVEKSSGERTSFDVQLAASKITLVDEDKFSLGNLYE